MEHLFYKSDFRQMVGQWSSELVGPMGQVK